MQNAIMQNAILKLKLYGLKRFIKYAIFEKIYLEIWMQRVRNSYSQAGEDIIIDQLLGNKKSGFYIDVGAYDPNRFNNTKRFYKRGWTGINIEPNIVYFQRLEQRRPKEINLNLGISNKATKLNFYKFFPDTLSTFSKDRAMRYKTQGFKFVGKTRVQTVKLSDIVKKYRKSKNVDFLSVDTEGLELEVLKSNNWKVALPKVICIESSRQESSTKSLEKFLLRRGYKKYWSGPVNDIYTLSMQSQHHQGQAEYFDREFSQARYKLSPWKESYIERIKAALGYSYKGKMLIDVGTGGGYVAIEMAKRGMRVVACDLAPRVIEHIKQYKKRYKLKNLKGLLCLAESIPLPNRCADIVVANAVLEHIPDEEQAIKEWKRLLKPRGKIFIATPIKMRYIWPFFWPINYLHDKRIGHLRRYDADELADKFDMRVESVYYTGHILKMLWLLLTKLIGVELFEKDIETIDNAYRSRRYGSNNIVVVLR